MSDKQDKFQIDMIDSETRLQEDLSALMDGESNELELRRILRELPDRPELAASWRRYHVIRDTINGEIHCNPATNLLEGIHQALEAESAVPQPARRKAGLDNFLRFAGQGAIAASVVAMVLTGVTYFEASDSRNEGASMIASQDDVPELGGDYTPSEFTRVVRMNDAARSRLQQAVFQFSSSPDTAGIAEDSGFPFEPLEPFLPEQQEPQENQEPEAQ